MNAWMKLQIRFWYFKILTLIENNIKKMYPLKSKFLLVCYGKTGHIHWAILLIIMHLKLSFAWLKCTRELEFCSNTLNSFSCFVNKSLNAGYKSPATFQWNLTHWSSYSPTFIKAISLLCQVTDPEILAHKAA